MTIRLKNMCIGAISGCGGALVTTSIMNIVHRRPRWDFMDASIWALDLYFIAAGIILIVSAVIINKKESVN